MEFLNIGIPELIFILLLMLILLGPEGMVKTARKIASEARKIIRSPMWRDLMRTQQEIQDLPSNFLREAGLEDIKNEIQQTQQEARESLNQAAQSIPLDLPSIQVPAPSPSLQPGEENQLDDVQPAPPVEETQENPPSQ